MGIMKAVYSEELNFQDYLSSMSTLSSKQLRLFRFSVRSGYLEIEDRFDLLKNYYTRAWIETRVIERIDELLPDKVKKEKDRKTNDQKNT